MKYLKDYREEMTKLKNRIHNFFSAIRKNQYPEFRYIQKKKI